MLACLVGGALAVAATWPAAGPAQYQYQWRHETYNQAYPSDARALVISWYQRYLHRSPGNGEEMGWVNQLANGAAPETLLANILGSQEYFKNAGSTPQGFVQSLFEDLAGRRPTPQEVQYWVSQLYYNYNNNYYDDSGGRNNVAYSMLMRYPQSFGAPAPYYPDDHRYKYQPPVYPPYKKY
jgi:hypothetical protein